MSNKINFEVKNVEIKTKLSCYLKDSEGISTRLTRQAARERRIMVNGSNVRMDYIVKNRDIISIELDKDESQNIEPQKMDIQVVYEDEDIIVVNKSPGIVVHPTKSYPEGTLANGLLYYFKETGQNCIVRLVSRLDMDTSGLIIVAKNQFSHMALARDMQNDNFEKHYIAIIHGNMENKQGTIDLPIYRTGEGSIKRVIDERGQRSITHYKVRESFKDAEIVGLTLETGRTHQIRVHLSHIGHPIYGDTLYGLEGDNIKYINRQALHAYRLVIPHPRTGEKLELQCDIPRDMENLIKML